MSFYSSPPLCIRRRESCLLTPSRSMLAVMTMNVGYFLSILGGTFLGSLAIGRFAISAGH